MLPPRLSRILLRHQQQRLRPVLKKSVRLPSRPFTSNRRLLLSVPPVRPQLPFLATPSRTLRPQRHPRLISTERSAYYARIYQGIKLALTCYLLVVLYYVARTGLHQEQIERMFPTPDEWTLWSRWKLRSARALMSPERFGRILVDWPRVGRLYRELLERLEDRDGDGAGMSEAVEGGLFVDGVGKASLDISGKSAAWRQGYFQALMGAGAAAEKLDGWVEDTESSGVGPAEAMIGPSNPNPRPLPPRFGRHTGKGKGAKAELREERCVPAYEGPEAFYVKILTTVGFKPNQRLDAALAYADWLDYKGLSETADDVYAWAADIALAGHDAGTLDRRTGVLHTTSPTDNMLRLLTALGRHRVKTGDLPGALSTFVSVLRARRSLPASAVGADSEPVEQKDPISRLVRLVSSTLIAPPYPVSPLTGDERPAMRSAANACEEAGLMVYIGEILFATAAGKETPQTPAAALTLSADPTITDGLAWTRDAVDLAESALLQLNDGGGESDGAVALDAKSSSSSSSSSAANNDAAAISMNHAPPVQRCRDCLKAGLDNWSRMLQLLVERAETAELAAAEQAQTAAASTTSTASSSSSWLPSSFLPSLSFWPFTRNRTMTATTRAARAERRRWAAEEELLAGRIQRGAMRALVGDQGLEDMGVRGIY